MHTRTVAPHPRSIPPGTYYDLRAIFAQRLLKSTDNAKGDANSTTAGAVRACTPVPPAGPAPLANPSMASSLVTGLDPKQGFPDSNIISH